VGPCTRDVCRNVSDRWVAEAARREEGSRQAGKRTGTTVSTPARTSTLNIS
jgi:hypothetical protein